MIAFITTFKKKESSGRESNIFSNVRSSQTLKHTLIRVKKYNTTSIKHWKVVRSIMWCRF